MNPIITFLTVVFIAAGVATAYWINPLFALLFFATAAVVATSLKMANTWETFVILRMGQLQSVKGAGLFAIIPILDNVVAVIDGRIQTTAFNAEQALTRDTVPVNVDAIIFWHVHNAEKAALATCPLWYRASLSSGEPRVEFERDWAELKSNVPTWPGFREDRIYGPGARLLKIHKYKKRKILEGGFDLPMKDFKGNI